MTVAMPPVERHQTLADGTVVGYAEVGDPGGHPVMWLHGTPTCHLDGTFLVWPIPEAAKALGVRLIAPDRPGIGRSTLRRYSVADYPEIVRSFADMLGLERFSVVALSGGGRYACACAWRLHDRVTRLVLESSTCSFDLPGAMAGFAKLDRMVYALARRAPWLLRPFFAKLARDIRRGDLDAVLSGRELCEADAEILTHEDIRDRFLQVLAGAFQQGARGPAHDQVLEARPWGIPLDQIRVPTEIWHGEDDRIVPPSQSRILTEVLPMATAHFIPGEGHFSLAMHHAKNILQSAL